ncbi:MAG: cupin domain-containing protein [Candidatus Brockarchaeota archaeon]|nr:cupin domain-containing protein [Candidatus Brockarchaeota archaeon]
MDRWDLTRLAEFSKTQRVKKDICKTKTFSIVLVCLETGQEILPRPEPYDVCFYIVEGQGIFTIGDEQKNLKRGSMTFAPAHIARGIKSIKRLSVLGIQEAH